MTELPADTLRQQALVAFDLPPQPLAAEALAAAPGEQALRLRVPAGQLLLLFSSGGPLSLAFEATLFDLLAESRYPAPRPRRARGGSLIAKLAGPRGPAAATCYPWPPGELLGPERATTPHLLEVGRLLARLHRLGEAHPASVPDPLSAEQLLARLPQAESGGAQDRLGPLLRERLPPWPQGAVHGRFGPRQLLFVGDRVSAVLPAGVASSAPWLVDVAEALVAWALPAPEPLPALRGLLAGYQALRRLMPGERDGLWFALRHTAAREGVRRLLGGEAAGALDPLEGVLALGEGPVRAAAG
jgi:Ser/Thr protein kinase RdoA (MazF antagonist)